MKIIKCMLAIFLGLVMASCGGGSSGSYSSPSDPVSLPVVTYPLPELRFLVIGQSISSNCNEYKYGPVDNVFQIGSNGSVKAAADPFEWADCDRGSMWMPLGKKLIDAGIARKVIFMPIGVSGSKVEDWQVNGAAFKKLNAAISLIQGKGIDFDFAIWHQGSSNIGMEKNVYMTRLGSVIDYVNERVKINRWLIGVHSRCFGGYDRNIESAQLEMGNMPRLKRFIGANNNLLGDEYRIDSCHLKKNGQDEMAGMWLESVKLALK
ncbi:hypothetical protein O0881_21500 [Janthinobacterium sp. SUN100]|uniref:sialate O-acetylesterase n=1 Tax=Janthinobacterium sp. SUN100 TaxID=3004101 RepID=UPI0025B0D269|nr:sialate O-acetylesterase [Janthinobacterium sp. SUN100]MDN2704562.1 hypothetical protein [Janthinobacterium sp. SUN100]